VADEIKMDRQVFEALASETRIDLLKKLDTRQMTISELSRELDMAKSSIHEHLAKMASSGLVEKFDNGHKWTYYYLTRKGRNILHPHETAKILVLLGVSLLAIARGALDVFSLRVIGSGAPVAMEAAEAPMLAAPSDSEMAAMREAPKAAEHAAGSAEPSILIGGLLIAGGILIGYIAYRMWSKARPKRFKQGAG
jgi:DNA-binding transcriptional ArsR family regulator